MKIIIFGGCAVHLYTHHRVSTDVDAEILQADIPADFGLRELLAETPEDFFDDATGRTMELNYDLSYTSVLGPLHEDYVERGVPLADFTGGSPLHIFIANPVDIAISKLNRATEQDLGDIMALLRYGFIESTELERLALQAIDVYVGNQEPPKSILRNLLQDYLETQDDEAP